ncbi:MAG TPA: hypothetical protein VF972_09515 [Actinomycetota bacterium]
MDRLIERCAGLDVHKATVTACVRVPGEAGARRTQAINPPPSVRRGPSVPCRGST